MNNKELYAEVPKASDTIKQKGLKLAVVIAIDTQKKLHTILCSGPQSRQATGGVSWQVDVVGRSE